MLPAYHIHSFCLDVRFRPAEISKFLSLISGLLLESFELYSLAVEFSLVGVDLLLLICLSLLLALKLIADQ
jgi:hypothetical protein